MIFAIFEKKGCMTDAEGLAQSVMVPGIAAGFDIFVGLQEGAEAHGN